MFWLLDLINKVSLSDRSVASVDEKGKVTTNNTGSATITVVFHFFHIV